jgi:hypothetical protein
LGFRDTSPPGDAGPMAEGREFQARALECRCHRAMYPVRIWGDPFAPGASAALSRALLQLCAEREVRCGLSLTPVREPAVPAPLPPDDLERIRAAAATAVPGTAPVLVFAPVEAMAENALLAGLEWPQACKILPAPRDSTAAELLARVLAELWRAGAGHAEACRSWRELEPWFELPPACAGGPIVHPGSRDPAHGTDLVLHAWSLRLAATGCRLRLVLDGDEQERAARCEQHTCAMRARWRCRCAPRSVSNAWSTCWPRAGRCACRVSRQRQPSCLARVCASPSAAGGRAPGTRPPTADASSRT